MIPKLLVLWGILAAGAYAQPAIIAQDNTNSGDLSVPISRPRSANLSQPGGAGSRDCGPPTYPMPQITVAAPPAVSAGWPLHERIAWAANLVLVIMGYAGIMVALSTLKKIERQAMQTEEAVTAAGAAAKSALMHAQATLRSERPWIMITAEPCPDKKYSSTVVATNRGKSPARIVATAQAIASAIDEAHLAATPEYSYEPTPVEPAPIILFPGESTALTVFGREDVERYCVTEDKLKRVQGWEEKIFLLGKVTYEDLNAPEDRQLHDTGWCCWYIYGKEKSGLVTIALPALTMKG